MSITALITRLTHDLLRDCCKSSGPVLVGYDSVYRRFSVNEGTWRFALSPDEVDSSIFPLQETKIEKYTARPSNLMLFKPDGKYSCGLNTFGESSTHQRLNCLT